MALHMTINKPVLIICALTAGLFLLAAKPRVAPHGIFHYREPFVSIGTKRYVPGVVPLRFSASAKRFDAWQVIGPGGGGALVHGSISPHDPKLAVLSSDMGGNYITHDGGATWRMFNLYGSQQVIFDPINHSTIYAYGGRMIWKSTDIGASWRLIYPNPNLLMSMEFVDDEADVVPKTSHYVGGPIQAMAIDPADSRILYVAGGGEARVSRDGGTSWHLLGTASAIKILINPESPRDNRDVLFIGRNRVFELANGHLKQNPPILDTPVWVIDADGGFVNGKPRIYVIFEHQFVGTEPQVTGGIMASDDAGRTWHAVDESILAMRAKRWQVPEYSAIAALQGSPEQLYVSYQKLRIKDDRGGPYFGVAKSTTGGTTWSFPWKQATGTVPNVHDAWLSEWFGADWGEQPLSMAVGAGVPTTIMTGDFGRCMRSIDGGLNWTQCYSARMDDGSYITNGIDVTTSYGVHFDPFDPKRVFISYTDIGLFRSENGGHSWVGSTDEVPRQWRNTTYWMVFDPAVKGKAWV